MLKAPLAADLLIKIIAIITSVQGLIGCNYTMEN